MGLILYLATGNRNSFIQRKEIKIMDDFFNVAESEKSLDLSQNRPVKVTALTAATAGKSLETHFSPCLCQSEFHPWIYVLDPVSQFSHGG